jgi:methylamine dehydrogenase heavy chain
MHCKPAAAFAGSLVVSLCLALLSAALPASSLESESAGAVATLPPIGAHWVWVPDRLFEHSLLFDGDRSEVMATIDSNASLTPKVPLLARSRNEIYSVDIDYARGRRGTRTDYVTIYDATTLAVTGEVVLPHPTSESNTSLAHVALLDDDRFLLAFSQFPNATVSVVDVAARAVVAAVPVAGCAGIYPAGPLRFATLCGDGSIVMTELTRAGRPARTARSAAFFDVVTDPISMAGARIGASWVFVSFAGLVYEVDLSGVEPKVGTPWSLVDDAEQRAEWRPGGLQPVALHQTSGRLFVVMHQGGAGTHKDPGSEIWVYELAQQDRIAKISLPNLTADFLGPMLGIEAGGFVSWMLRTLTPNPGAHTIAISQDEDPLLFVRNAELGVVAVIDPGTGSPLRTLNEVGLSGPTLGVP